MKKLLVVLAVLALAVPAMADWAYYKGIDGDAWGSMPAAIDTVNGAWSIVSPAGASQSVNGVLYQNFATNVGDRVTLTFTLNTVNMPAAMYWTGEGDNGMWSDVFIQDKVGLTAQDCMAGTNGATWTDHMRGDHRWNDWYGTGGGYWHSAYHWTNDTNIYNTNWAGYHYLGADSSNLRINDARTFSKTYIATSNNLFIGIKTGCLNLGTNEAKGITYGQYISNFTLVTPEPSSFLALGTGLMGLAGYVIRRRK